METIKSILIHDETEENLQALNKKKKNRPKRRFKITMLIVVLVVIALSLYFYSDLSKVKSLKVEGNYYFNDKEILTMADLSYDTRHITIFPFIHENRLEKHDLIKSVNIHKTFSGVVTIQVEEEDIIGTYQENKKTYLLLGDGSSMELAKEDQNRIVKFPMIGKFSKEQRELMAQSFVKDEGVKDEIMLLISEINPHQESYDKNMVELIMEDGNRIYTSYDSMILLNAYKKTLKSLKEDNVCFVMDSLTGSYVTEDCKAFQ